MVHCRKSSGSSVEEIMQNLLHILAARRRNRKTTLLLLLPLKKSLPRMSFAQKIYSPGLVAILVRVKYSCVLIQSPAIWKKYPWSNILLILGPTTAFCCLLCTMKISRRPILFTSENFKKIPCTCPVQR